MRGMEGEGKGGGYFSHLESEVHEMQGFEGKKWWDNLAPDLQQILWRLFKQEGEKLNQKLKMMSSKIFDDHEATPENSATIITEAEKKRWRKVIKPIYEELLKDEEIRMVIEAANTTR